MVDVKTAVNIAVNFLSDTLPNSTAIRLEEIESHYEEGYDWTWLITLSYIEKSEVSVLTKLGMPDYNPPRFYKVIALRKEDGEVVSLKIRQGINA